MRSFKLKLMAFLGIAVIGGFLVWFGFRGGSDNPQIFSLEMPATYAEAMKVQIGGDNFFVKPVNANDVAREDANEEGQERVKYIGAYTNTDVVQTIYATKIKEDIILQSAGHPVEFAFELNLGEFAYEVDEQGNINFYSCQREATKNNVIASPIGRGNPENNSQTSDNQDTSGCATGLLRRSAPRNDTNFENLEKILTIPAPYMIDANGVESAREDVEVIISGNVLTLKPSAEWLASHQYPIILDPTIELSVLNLYSHPLLGDDWEVSFTTMGTADLYIIPNDQATVDDDEFVSLWCGDTQVSPTFKGGDEGVVNNSDTIFVKDWSCSEVGRVIHNTKKAGDHTLRFQFGDEIAYAYNHFTGDRLYAWSENAGWINASTTVEKVTVAPAGLTGKAWAENLGWINFDYDSVAGATNTTATDWGVTNDGDGNLGGYAWGENIGWINFNASSSQVTINYDTGDFEGYAWAENIGWINFGHSLTNYVIQDIGEPVVVTRPPINVASKVVTVVGQAYRHGYNLTIRGFEYGLTATNTWSQVESNIFGSGEFKKPIGGLSPNTTYYVRAFAKNSEGTTYGEYVSFTTENEIKHSPIIFNNGTIFSSDVKFGNEGLAPSTWTCGFDQVSDEDGNSYETVLIGTQCWMAENLNVGVYVASVNTGLDHSDVSDNATIERYCYGNTEANCDTYGGLYDWDEMMGYATTTGIQGICPSDWHIPSDAEWYELENYLKDEGETCDAGRSGTYDCVSAGTKLKVGGSADFSGLLAGNRYYTGDFNGLSSNAYFWSSSVSGANAWRRYLSSSEAGVGRNTGYQTNGFSVRCLKD